uniref:Uncharacterized protein n=1 Tax=Nonomuraea gerenzanensis TaxID=93944 RepID=A0A1M4E6Y3_9ACTN|nr:hypothetical protein [Nonomuraea gerenzanensis]SBO94621.1 hypothetical protein BN4615_P4137 [Nonomuraea gerenzanensis]
MSHGGAPCPRAAWGGVPVVGAVARAAAPAVVTSLHAPPEALGVLAVPGDAPARGVGVTAPSRPLAVAARTSRPLAVVAGPPAGAVAALRA